jgi:hypothetical protein
MWTFLEVDTPSKPPSISLRTSPALPATVSVVQGQGYAACASGVVPSPSTPCELGATALDAQGRNISVQVSTCAGAALAVCEPTL